MGADATTTDPDLRATSAEQERAAAEQASPAARSWIERFREAWADLDADKLGDLLHPGLRTIVIPFRDEPVDRDGLVDFWRSTFQAMPDMRLEVQSWASAGDNVFVEWKANATINGRPVTWRGADRFTLDGERAIAERVFTDTHVLREALAAAPPEA